MGATISALATAFFGERWVERSRLKREHSTKLVAETFKPWLGQYKKRCIAGAVYSRSEDKLTGHKPEDPNDLPFFDAARAHLTSGYTEILREWNKYKEDAFRHNVAIAAFMDRIRVQLTESVKLKQYHPHFGEKRPQEYVIPENIARAIYHALIYETRNGEGYFIAPKIQRMQEGNFTFFELWMSDTRLAKSKGEEKLEKVGSFIKGTIALHENKQEVMRLTEAEDGPLSLLAAYLDMKINELIKYVELGKRLKGKCKYCP